MCRIRYDIYRNPFVPSIIAILLAFIRPVISKGILYPFPALPSSSAAAHLSLTYNHAVPHEANYSDHYDQHEHNNPGSWIHTARGEDGEYHR